MDDLLGASEVAKELGVSRQRVYQLAETHTNFPKPVAQLSRGALWSGTEVRRWAYSWRREGGRPRGKPL